MQPQMAGAIARAPEQAIMPELGRIKLAAERIASAAYNVETFRTRFYGPGPESGEATKEADSNYRNDLGDLFEQIERLELAVNSLTSIG